jgi:hypothetical protein
LKYFSENFFRLMEWTNSLFQTLSGHNPFGFFLWSYVKDKVFYAKVTSLNFMSISLISLVTLKCVCLRIKLSLHSTLFSFFSVHICAPFICMFSLAGCMSLLWAYSQLVRTHTMGAQTWTPKNENSVEQRKGVLFSNKHILVWQAILVMICNSMEIYWLKT